MDGIKLPLFQAPGPTLAGRTQTPGASHRGFTFTAQEEDVETTSNLSGGLRGNRIAQQITLDMSFGNLTIFVTLLSY